MTLSVILPAHDEAAYLGDCLDALLASEGALLDIVVVANACGDATADVARGFARKVAQRGWRLQVIETPVAGKLNALNLGDQTAASPCRAYLDADVIVTPRLMGQIAGALAGPAPCYASGTPQISPAESGITRAYARFWSTLPFVTQGAPGFGLFAVNAAGRARWGLWPDIISDDTFARLHFTPEERVQVQAPYRWPMVEGFAPLVRVRRRQNAGVQEISRAYPALLSRDTKQPLGLRGLARRVAHDPLGFAVYGAVALAVKTPLFASKSRWARGR
ncbi:MAG: glycosyltransferase [Rhodobacterales bacterium]|nr:glycosyltransferase [Rhodobacterales bacterium]